MNSYKHIPIWENAQRINALVQFRNDVVIYFNNSENQGAEATRRRINFSVDQAHGYIRAANVNPALIYTSSLTSNPGHFDLITNLFALGPPFDIPPQRAIDIIDRAIGVYQLDRRAAWYRTVNPLWWLWRGFLWSVRIPFFFLGSVGFDVASAEKRGWGKWVRVLTVVAELLTILYLMGWLPAAKTLLGIK